MDVDLVQPKQLCKTCRINIIPSHLSYLNCNACREKKRLQDSRRLARQRELARSLQERKEIFMDTMLTMDVDRPTREYATAISSGSGKSSSTLSVGTSKGKQKKKQQQQQPPPPSKLLHELEGKEKRRAIRKIKVSLQKTIEENGGAMIIDDQPALSGTVTEFQTGSSLYDKLKSRANRYSAAGKPLKFQGCHSIIAVPTIDNADRVEMVVNDLRKIAQISFGRSTTWQSLAENSISLDYDCRCLFAAGGNLPGPSNKAPVECHGTVRITAELDVSHPRGLEGQKISVFIKH